MRHLVPWLLPFLVACGSQEEATPSTAPLAAAPREGEILLDGLEGRALYGRVLPAVPDGDPDRVLVLRTSFASALDGTEVLDARFVQGQLVTLGVDHVLRLHALQTGLQAGVQDSEAVELDGEVVAPLSVAGPYVAYARGIAPNLEIARADVSTGAIDAMTSGMQPAWSPALSSDGREVIFVSGASGEPRLYRSSGSQAILLPRSRFPTMPRAPRWEGRTLLFEDEAGLARIDLGTGQTLRANAAPPAHTVEAP
ncbi:MAG: hypothetical protein K8H88_25640 [Sandaracinaceae bacterium]|nr:hypothetical protein [Sandaracinaceae bacterium]